MNPLGSNPDLGDSSPGKRNPGYGWMAKEADLGDMIQPVPKSGSPKTTKDYRTKNWSQTLFEDKEEISEASLAEGFTFPRREPPRPGQFSNIPQHGSVAKPLNIQLSEPRPNLISSPKKDKTAAPLARASPLNLPELCLPDKLTDVGSGISEAPQQSKLKSLFSMHPDHSNLKDSSYPQSSSPKNAEEKNKSTKLLSPPKLTSSPVQSRYQELPTTIDRNVALYMHDSTYRAPQSLSHTKSTSPNEQRQSPPSTCGDLEPPTYRNPTKPRHHHHKELTNRPAHRGSAKDHKQLSRHRSSSIASSNISKKRSRVHKIQAKQYQAMEQFTETWNECLQITDEEVIEARWEIQRLRGDIQHQEAELEKTRALLDQKDTKLCEAEKLYKVLLEEDTRVLGDNKSLNLELTSLHQQLSEEKTRGELLKEKHQESRSRLNEAIREQQDLFSRSRDLCQETMNQLRKEKACKVSVSDAVDKALETSHKKREEMKKCLEEYRWQTEKDNQQKDQVISELKEKLSHQETLLAQEKLFADNLRAQAEEQSIAHDCVQTLEAKVDALVAHHAAQSEQRELDAQQSTQMIEMLSSKLDSLIEGGNLVVSNMLSRDDLKVRLSIAEKNIMESITPVILTLEGEKRDTANAVTQLEASIQRELDHLKDKSAKLMSTWEENKEGNNMQVQELLNEIQELNGGLKKTENTCEQMGQKFDALVDSEQTNQRVTDTLLQDFTNRFLAREVRLDDMECQLQQTYEGFTTRTEAMISGALNKEKETTKLVHNAVTELRDVLEQGLEQEREGITQLLLRSENTAKALTAHINEHKQPNTQTDHNTHDLQATLESERETAAQLTHKVQALEQKAQESEVLRDQWLRDIRTVETARAQLKAIQEQTSPVEMYTKKLDRIVEISRSIQSSASYLATENKWVQEELIARIPTPTIEADKTPPALSTESNGMTKNRPPAKEDAACRKVTVYSPDPGEGSPMPPPTVMQEQKRRREITQLRSILKSHVQSGAIESTSIDGPSTTLQTNHSKPPIHPSNSSLNKSGSFSSKEMVAEICSRMVRHDWSFPTVADFERDIQLAGKKREAPQGNPMSSQLDSSNYRDPKKLKTECYITE